MVQGSQSQLPDAPVAVGDGQLGLKLGDLVAQSSVLGQQQGGVSLRHAERAAACLAALADPARRDPASEAFGRARPRGRTTTIGLAHCRSPRVSTTDATGLVRALGPACSARPPATLARRGDGRRLRDQRPRRPVTVGVYAATWIKRHPRARRTNTTNDGRLRQVLDVELEGRRLRDWPVRDLKRRHALELVAHMLTVQGRAPSGAQNILRALSAMAEDAITTRSPRSTSSAA
jgi:hypothetical protein